MVGIVGAIWALLIISDYILRLQHPGPKSYRHLAGARILSEAPNVPKRPWPLLPIIASRLNVASLNKPYVLAEDHTPRWQTTDAYGFRKSHSALPYNVLLCGDSFFVNDVIADSVAHWLGKSVGNAAIDGRGTLTMARLLDAPSPNFQHPDIVVWTRLESAIDSAGFLGPFGQYRRELQPAKNPLFAVYKSWRESFFWPSNADGYLNESAPFRPELQHLASELNWVLKHQADTTVLLGTKRLPAGVAPMQFLHDEQALLATARPLSEIELVADQVKRVQKELAAKGIVLIFAVAPDKSEVYPDRLPEGRHYHGGFIARFNAALQRRHVPVIDLATGLRREALKHPMKALYYTTDTHWNPFGQAIGARIIADSLRRWQVLHKIQPHL